MIHTDIEFSREKALEIIRDWPIEEWVSDAQKSFKIPEQGRKPRDVDEVVMRALLFLNGCLKELKKEEEAEDEKNCCVLQTLGVGLSFLTFKRALSCLLCLGCPESVIAIECCASMTLAGIYFRQRMNKNIDKRMARKKFVKLMISQVETNSFKGYWSKWKQGAKRHTYTNDLGFYLHYTIKGVLSTLKKEKDFGEDRPKFKQYRVDLNIYLQKKYQSQLKFA